jgi:hypothetical protein
VIAVIFYLAVSMIYLIKPFREVETVPSASKRSGRRAGRTPAAIRERLLVSGLLMEP